jgi:hypothetical protein
MKLEDLETFKKVAKELFTSLEPITDNSLISNGVKESTITELRDRHIIGPNSQRVFINWKENKYHPGATIASLMLELQHQKAVKSQEINKVISELLMHVAEDCDDVMVKEQLTDIASAIEDENTAFLYGMLNGELGECTDELF